MQILMEWEILETPWLLFVDNRDKNTINKFSILYYLFFKISVQIYMSIFNGQTLGVGMGGGILCPSHHSRPNCIKKIIRLKTIINSNSIPIVAIITTGPTFSLSYDISYGILTDPTPMYIKKINEGITSNIDHYFHISWLIQSIRWRGVVAN